ncbi:hypothetical protein LTS13_009116 [Exophiala xenobiotica]|nr:hypothetical protein LTR93_009893 [Exophiala xenobiotica]KAK5539348.1 hypothetical protein LTR23_006569 [Chaetothyriales sp. CCFEE 6169]KAK5363482.1 hypothetical protein LTS13_009116 [Exophiala xenobiotica]KAK5402554.1 hypothetical protein LTR79_001282 [Exophiala xenobiotica]KAK5484754.1 hypothetical protein LTR83_008579 [Exophiala xenobiotica]
MPEYSCHSLHPSSSSAPILPVTVTALDQTRVQRRRSQNRASQRAFRERKTRHTENIEASLRDLAETHRLLRVAYQQKADEADALRARVEMLDGDVSTLQVSAKDTGDFAVNLDGDCGAQSVVKLENEDPIASSFNRTEPEMDWDLFPIYVDTASASIPWRDLPYGYICSPICQAKMANIGALMSCKSALTI